LGKGLHDSAADGCVTHYFVFVIIRYHNRVVANFSKFVVNFTDQQNSELKGFDLQISTVLRKTWSL